MSYISGNIPADWKLANVVPVHKKGSKSEVSNYRPISLTSIIMKLYERVIRDELLSRCNHRIDQRQHGFLARKSCCTQMVDFCDSLALSLNDNIRSDVIYFDFQKAFDSVNHDLILKKLKYQYDIDGSLLRFFVSYLRDRFQRVVMEFGAGRRFISESPGESESASRWLAFQTRHIRHSFRSYFRSTLSFKSPLL